MLSYHVIPILLAEGQAITFLNEQINHLMAMAIFAAFQFCPGASDCLLGEAKQKNIALGRHVTQPSR